MRKYITLRVDDISLSEVTNHFLDISWTRDVFDRMITAHAIATESPLITRDHKILENYSMAIWK